MSTKPRQNEDALVMALAAGATAADASRQAGVSARTVHRWLGDEQFAARVRRARDGMVAQAVGVLSLASVRAATTLVDLLHDKSSTVRLSAAKAILEARQRLWEGTELEERLAALEQRAAGLTEHEGIANGKR